METKMQKFFIDISALIRFAVALVIQLAFREIETLDTNEKEKRASHKSSVAFCAFVNRIWYKQVICNAC